MTVAKLEPETDRLSRLVGNQDAEAQYLDLLFAGPASQMGVDTFQTLAGPLRVDFRKNAGQKPLKAGQGFPKLRRIVQGRPYRQSGQDYPEAATRNLLGFR